MIRLRLKNEEAFLDMILRPHMRKESQCKIHVVEEKKCSSCSLPFIPSFIHFSFFISFHFIRLVSFCLLFLMATLQEKINALEEEIAMYEQEYVNASPEVKKELRAVIIAIQREEIISLPSFNNNYNNKKVSSCLSLQHRCFD